MGGALLVAAFASVKLFLSTSKDQHTLKVQHTKEDSSSGSGTDSRSIAAGSTDSKANSAENASSQTGLSTSRTICTVIDALGDSRCIDQFRCSSGVVRR